MLLVLYESTYSKFFRRNVNLTHSYYSSKEIEKNLQEYDVYMTGSDQVWNTFYNHGIDKLFYLDFAPRT